MNAQGRAGGADPRAAGSVGAHSYRGRFAPSPTGPLHAGSLVAALASWLDARAHGGAWLVRIEDVDTPRCVPGADRTILAQLADCALVADEPVTWQSQRSTAYQQALDRLVAAGLAYPCACSRSDIEAEWARRGVERGRHGERVYPGTCRDGLNGRTARAWRFRTGLSESKHQESIVEWSQSAMLFESAEGSAPGSDARSIVHWFDRRLGTQAQDVEREVGDFVLRRADGLWAYQLAVVVDDADQGITDIVRGEDLADNTPRQILLQRALGLPTPRYLHTPLVLASDGQKLSKQNGAAPLDTRDPMRALNAAAAILGLPTARGPVPAALAFWTDRWRQRWGQPSGPERTKEGEAIRPRPAPTIGAPSADPPKNRLP